MGGCLSKEPEELPPECVVERSGRVEGRVDSTLGVARAWAASDLRDMLKEEKGKVEAATGLSLGSGKSFSLAAGPSEILTVRRGPPAAGRGGAGRSTRTRPGARGGGRPAPAGARAPGRAAPAAPVSAARDGCRGRAAAGGRARARARMRPRGMAHARAARPAPSQPLPFPAPLPRPPPVHERPPA
jgi:hypothetical protein